MNTRATKLVLDLQQTSSQLRELRKTLWGFKERYTHEGGQSFIHQHFLDENGDPRTDLEYTEQQMIDFVAALSDIISTLTTHAATIIKIAN